MVGPVRGLQLTGGVSCNEQLLCLVLIHWLNKWLEVAWHSSNAS
jgi:hypothetical protein